jgi:hypothetical protein
MGHRLATELFEFRGGVRKGGSVFGPVMPAGRITGTQKDYEARRSEKNGQANPEALN